MTHKQFGIPIGRTVTDVRIENELSIRKILLQDECVYGVKNNVIATMHDQGRLFDRLQVVERPLRRPPLAYCLKLGGYGFLIHVGITILAPKTEAS